MKKILIITALILSCILLSLNSYAAQEDVYNYFNNNDGVYAFEHGDGENKSLVIYVHILGSENFDKDFDEKSNDIIEKLGQAINEDWYDYEYVMFEVWNEDFGRMIPQTYNANTFETLQSVDWFADDVMNELIVEDYSEEESEQNYSCSYKNMDLNYIGHEITWNDIDEKVLVVYYDFTNNSNKNQSFDYSFDNKCFQNGVEIESSWWNLNTETENSEKEIKPGTTVTVASSFVLGDSMDDIELEVTPLWDDEILLSVMIELE